MKMTGIETIQFLARDGVAEIELMRTDDVTLAPKAEEFRFHGIEIELRIDGRGEDFVERRGEPFAGSFAIGGQVLVAVGDPEIRHRRLAELPPGLRGDTPAGDTVIDPILTHRTIPMR